MGHHHHLEYRYPEPLAPGMLAASSRTSSSFEQIPVINLHDAFTGDASARRELANRIRDACINVGFFYIDEHGIPENMISDAVNASKTFFALPESAKMELDIHKTSNYKGYTALLGENTDPNGKGDLHEGFDIGWEPEGSSPTESREDGAMTGSNIWPKAMPEFRKALLTYYHAAVRLGTALFPLFAMALDLPENFFDDKTTKPAAIMRVLRYPPQNPTSVDVDGRVIGIGAHTELTQGHQLSFISYECFTILWQDSAGGLQVQNASEEWIDAVPIPGTLVLNLGDQFARWTNDVFKSTVHRAINLSGAERYSMPLFFGTDYDVLLEPIPSCVDEENPAKYEVVKAGDYVKSRLEATYAHSA